MQVIYCGYSNCLLRIVFSRDDVARTRVAPGADPLWELVLSLHLLRRPSLDPVLSGWRGGVREGLRGDGEMRSFYAVNPPNGYFPDFLTPHNGIHGLDAGLDAIRSTPKRRLRHELSLISSQPPGLARGEVPAVVQLTDAMKRYQEIAITPYLPQIRAAVDADRARRARTMLDSGAEGLLTGLHPGIQWSGGVLEVSNYPTERELQLDGRGLLLLRSRDHPCRPDPPAGAGLPRRPVGWAGQPPLGWRRAGRARRPHPGSGARRGRRRRPDE
jgi:hypothetical protein